MKKNIYFKIVSILFLFILFITSSNCYIFAKAPINPIGPVLDSSITSTTDSVKPVDSAVGKLWRTVVIVLQVVSIGAIIFAGVKYMFASPNAKADIKMQTLTLVLGAILVFGATTLIEFIRQVVVSVLM